MEELVDKPDVLEVRRKLLEGALQYYQEFIEQQADDASVQKKLAFGRARVAQILALRCPLLTVAGLGRVATL